MQNLLLHRYFHFNCRKKPGGERENANIFETRIVVFKILMLYFATSTPMESIGNSGKCCLEIPWCLEITWRALVLKLGQHQPRSVQPVHSHTHQEHTSLPLCACTDTPNDNFYWPSLFLVVFKALHRLPYLRNAAFNTSWFESAKCFI